MASEMFITDFKTMQGALDAAVNGDPINYTGVPPQPEDREQVWRNARDVEQKLKVRNLIAAIDLGIV